MKLLKLVSLIALVALAPKVSMADVAARRLEASARTAEAASASAAGRTAGVDRSDGGRPDGHEQNATRSRWGRVRRFSAPKRVDAFAGAIGSGLRPGKSRACVARSPLSNKLGRLFFVVPQHLIQDAQQLIDINGFGEVIHRSCLQEP